MQPFPHPSDATHKIWSRLANRLQRYSSLKVWTTEDDDGRRQTDDGPLVYYKLTLWAFGSGELKPTQNQITAENWLTYFRNLLNMDVVTENDTLLQNITQVHDSNDLERPISNEEIISSIKSIHMQQA